VGTCLGNTLRLLPGTLGPISGLAAVTTGLFFMVRVDENPVVQHLYLRKSGDWPEASLWDVTTLLFWGYLLVQVFFLRAVACTAAQDTLHACIIRDLGELDAVHMRRKVAYYRAVSRRWREIQTEELREQERKANAVDFGRVDLGDRVSVSFSRVSSSAASTDSGFDADALAALLAEDLDGVDNEDGRNIAGASSNIGDGSLMPGLVVGGGEAERDGKKLGASGDVCRGVSSATRSREQDPMLWRESRHGSKDLILRQLRAADAVIALRNVLARWSEGHQLMALKKRRVFVEVEEEEVICRPQH